MRSVLRAKNLLFQQFGVLFIIWPLHFVLLGNVCATGRHHKFRFGFGSYTQAASLLGKYFCWFVVANAINDKLQFVYFMSCPITFLHCVFFRLIAIRLCEYIWVEDFSHLCLSTWSHYYYLCIVKFQLVRICFFPSFVCVRMYFIRCSMVNRVFFSDWNCCKHDYAREEKTSFQKRDG